MINVRMLKIDPVVHVTVFGGLRKQEKTQHALVVGLGSAAVAAAVVSYPGNSHSFLWC